MSRIWRFLPLCLVLALAVGAIASGAPDELTLANLQAHHRQLHAFVDRRPAEALAIYVLIETLVVAACIPGPGLMSAAAGFLFGALVGGAACLAAAVAGSCLVYLACRTAFAGIIARRAGPRIAPLVQALQKNAFSYLLTLRLMPVMPLMAVNIAAGLAPAPPAAFFAASVLGGAPASFLLAAVGADLGRLFRAGVRVDAGVFMRPGLLLPLAVLALLSAAPPALRLMKRRREVGGSA